MFKQWSSVGFCVNKFVSAATQILGPGIFSQAPNDHMQPTHNSAQLFAHGFAISAQTPRSVVDG